MAIGKRPSLRMRRRYRIPCARNVPAGAIDPPIDIGVSRPLRFLVGGQHYTGPPPVAIRFAAFSAFRWANRT